MCKTYNLSYLVMVFILVNCVSCSTDSNEVNEVDNQEIEQEDSDLKTLISDMSEPHEARPSGVVNLDWAIAPRISYGNTPPEGWSAMTPWGQVYADEAGSPANNVRFQMRNLQTWYLSKSQGKWIPWRQSSNLEGANYAEDFQGDDNIEADIRDESSNGGGISATLVPGYNFHFWTIEGRVSIDPDDIEAVWSGVDARLIMDDANGADDRAEAKLMMSVGADYWSDLTAEWDEWKTNGDIFIGRFRYMDSEWQRYHAHTLTEAQIEQGILPPFREN